MKLVDSPAAYGTVSRFNHWAGGALVLALLGIGLYFHEMPRGDTHTWWRGLHVGVGTLALLLLAFRVLWRALAPSPAPPAGPVWLQRSRGWVHALLLGLIALMVLTGPLIVWTTGRPVDVFGWFQVASPLPRLPVLHDALEEVHAVASRMLLAAVLVHMGAALGHALTGNGRTLMARMLGSASR